MEAFIELSTQLTLLTQQLQIRQQASCEDLGKSVTIDYRYSTG